MVLGGPQDRPKRPRRTLAFHHARRQRAEKYDIGCPPPTQYLSEFKDNKENIHWKEIDKSLYTSINQGIVLLKHAKDNKEASSFYDFILSKKAKNIFREYGYLVK